MIGRRTGRRGRGFTLIEALVTTGILGVGVSALMVAVGSGTRVNGAGRELTEASFLAQEVREWTLKLPFSDVDPGDEDNPPGPDGTDPQHFVDDLDDLLDTAYTPPRDGQGAPISDMIGWTQSVSLTWRDPTDLATTVADGASDVVLVEVEILRDSRSILSTGWLVARRGG